MHKLRKDIKKQTNNLLEQYAEFLIAKPKISSKSILDAKIDAINDSHSLRGSRYQTISMCPLHLD